MERLRRRASVAAMLFVAAVATALAVALSAPAAHLAHLLATMTPTELCVAQGQPAGFYPPDQEPPEPSGAVVIDPFSVHCFYPDWLGRGPVTTVARGWPPLMALVSLLGLVGAVLSVAAAITVARRPGDHTRDSVSR